MKAQRVEPAIEDSLSLSVVLSNKQMNKYILLDRFIILQKLFKISKQK